MAVPRQHYSKRSPRVTARGNIGRVLDANINRAKEGLRVSEEVARFILNSRSLTCALKSARHRIDTILKKIPRSKDFLVQRDSRADIGKHIYGRELQRAGIGQIFAANMQRVKESLRVLEEFMKLESATAARAFKLLRYQVYEIEKKAARRLASVRHS